MHLHLYKFLFLLFFNHEFFSFVFRLKENILYESVIIMEEFCKELAAIAYVKYNHSM